MITDASRKQSVPEECSSEQIQVQFSLVPFDAFAYYNLTRLLNRVRPATAQGAIHLHGAKWRAGGQKSFAIAGNGFLPASKKRAEAILLGETTSFSPPY